MEGVLEDQHRRAGDTVAEALDLGRLHISPQLERRLDGPKGLRERERRLPLLGREVDVARGPREPVALSS